MNRDARRHPEQYDHIGYPRGDDGRLLAVPVSRLTDYLPCSRAQAFRWAAQGVVPTIRIGNMRCVPLDQLRALFAGDSEREQAR